MDDPTPGRDCCREVVELLTEYLEDALPVDRRERVDRHLEGCSDCSTYLDQMEFVIRLARSLCDEPGARDPRRALTFPLLRRPSPTDR